MKHATTLTKAEIRAMIQEAWETGSSDPLIIEHAGRALVRKRWDKTTPAERSEHGRKMARARWGLKPRD